MYRGNDGTELISGIVVEQHQQVVTRDTAVGEAPGQLYNASKR